MDAAYTAAILSLSGVNIVKVYEEMLGRDYD